MSICLHIPTSKLSGFRLTDIFADTYTDKCHFHLCSKRLIIILLCVRGFISITHVLITYFLPETYVTAWTMPPKTALLSAFLYKKIYIFFIWYTLQEFLHCKSTVYTLYQQLPWCLIFEFSFSGNEIICKL